MDDPAAERYAALLEPTPAIGENDAATGATTAQLVAAKSELQWQAHWFAGDFGASFSTTSGERVEIVQPGVWNHESGPDFREAAVRFPDRPGAPTLRGAVELDLRAEDWERHGHAVNPAFDAVVLHLFFDLPSRDAPAFFTRNSQHALIAQIALDPRGLDLAAPASTPLARPGRCVGPLRELPDDRVAALLAAAARHRLARKHARWARLAAARGADEALFLSLAAALGYKENQLPFTLLAQCLPLATLRAEEARAPGAAVSLLLGLGGFLEQPEPSALADPAHARETRAYLCARWEQWWTRRDEFQRLTLPRSAWTLHGLRPDNHPQRRLAALAAMVRAWPMVRALLDAPDPLRDVPRVLGALRDPFWNFHATLRAARGAHARALVGETRAVEMLANIFFPLAVHARGEPAWTQYARLPARLTNRRVETAAVRLFSDDKKRNATFLKTVVGQQGLLQIYEDFCQRDASDCARCRFPERVGRF
ncbi:MAG: DUF2851 family protein [Verrucomicrobia bacterium]|nr:DUF2851 family protein [Verrucomicrobiota bacterium]